MPLADDITRRLVQTRLLLARDADLAMKHQVFGPTFNFPAGTHPDHENVLRVTSGCVLGGVRIGETPWLPDWDPFGHLDPAQDRPPGLWYVVGEVHDVDLLVLNEDDRSVWFVDGEPGGSWPDRTLCRRLADNLADFLRQFVFGPRYHEIAGSPADDWPDVAARLDELQPLVEYLRYEAAEPTRRGTFPDPTSVDPTVYDRNLHPDARAFFRTDAHDLVEVTRGYLGLLDRHDVGWREIRTYDPGRILYEDDVQVVAEPWRAGC